MPDSARLGDPVERVVCEFAARAVPADPAFAARERSRDGIGRSRRYAARSRRRAQACGGQACKWSGAGSAEASSSGSSRCGAALDGVVRGAARKSRVGRPEHGVSQPPRVSQFSAMPYLRQRDRVPELQRQHDVSYARPLAPMPLLRQSYCGARHVPRMPWLRAQGPGLRHRETHAGVGGNDAGGEDRKDGLRYEQSARSARANAGRASRGRNRYPGRHANDHQGFRFSRRHAGRGGNRRFGAEHARLPLRRANLSVVDAGRGIIQTYAPNHYSIRAARDQDYARFMRRELQLRRDLMYPPFARLAMVRIEGAEPRLVRRLAEAVAKSLAMGSFPEGIRVLGPAPAPIERIKQRYRWQVMVKSRELKPMRAAIAAMRAEVGPSAERDGIFLAVDIDPVRML